MYTRCQKSAALLAGDSDGKSENKKLLTSPNVSYRHHRHPHDPYYLPSIPKQDIYRAEESSRIRVPSVLRCPMSMSLQSQDQTCRRRELRDYTTVENGT